MRRSEGISVVPGSLGAIKQALNASGWLDEEVIAAGELRQGTPLTMLGMVTGAAAVQLLRPRRSKSLPRHFVLAATADRIVAFKASGGGGDSDGGGPYFVKISPGERGSWPRASVRMVDLPDGGRSKGGTLELAGTERLPVARSGFDRDPDTDELIDLLGGGVVGTREVSGRERRHREDQDDLRRASAVRLHDFRELAADAVRGRPDTDLAGWADRRRLHFRGTVALAGLLSVTCPWSEDLLFNVVRGRWPGGTDGVVCHEARIYGAGAEGFFHPREWNGGERNGSRIVGAIDVIADLSGHPLPLMSGGGGELYFKAPYTSAGARVPHLATVTGLHVARRAERFTPTDELFGTWEARPLDDLGVRDHWIAAVRKRSDPATVERLLRGPIKALLSVQQGLGFEIRIEYGQVIVSRQDFVRRDEDLDALVADAEALARAVRDICVPPTRARALETPLPPPEWLAPVRRRPRKKHTLWPSGALLERVVQVAGERDMDVEDPRAFHAAFPDLNVPGEAFGVLRGRLPGTALSGRLLCCAERPMVLPDDYRAFLTDPGGPAGSDVAVLSVPVDAPATAPEGEVVGDLRVAVADGVLTAWRLRPTWQANGPALDRLAADVAAFVRARGLE